MKRKQFVVKRDGKVVARTNAWKSARRAVLTALRPLLNDFETAELFSAVYKRDMDGSHCEGSEIWQTSNGRAFVFTIERTA